MEGAWTRRPATAVSRLSGRPLLLLSARDLPAARDAALVASHVCQLELGLEIVPLGDTRVALPGGPPLTLNDSGELHGP